MFVKVDSKKFCTEINNDFCEKNKTGRFFGLKIKKALA